jgi:hypothetical protein
MKEEAPVRRTIALTILAALAVAIPGAALAAETTREEYKAKADPICETNTKANERILSGVREQVRQDKLKPAAAKFDKAAKALTKARQQLLALPQPAADKSRLANWFSYMKEEIELFGQVAKHLKAGEKSKAVRMTADLTRVGNRANAEVLGFNFDHCRFELSKFT